MRVVFVITPTAAGIGANGVAAFHDKLLLYKAISRDETSDTQRGFTSSADAPVSYLGPQGASTQVNFAATSNARILGGRMNLAEQFIKVKRKMIRLTKG